MVADDERRPPAGNQIRQIAHGVREVQVDQVGTEARQLARHGGTERHRGVSPEFGNADDAHPAEPLLDPPARPAWHEHRDIEVARESGAQELHVLLDAAGRGREVILEEMDDLHKTDAYAWSTRATWRSTSKRASARRRPAAPNRARSAGSRSRRTTAAAKAGASPGGTRYPVSPSSTISGIPPAAAATTGRPTAIASASARPNGSGAVGQCTRTSSAAR